MELKNSAASIVWSSFLSGVAEETDASPHNFVKCKKNKQNCGNKSHKHELWTRGKKPPKHTDYKQHMTTTYIYRSLMGGQ